jgi:hypothetical protein
MSKMKAGCRTRNSTEAGRQIDCNDEQIESADASIRVNFDPISNVNDESDLPDKKERLARDSPEAGREIDRKDEQLESSDFDLDSTVNDERDLHPKKEH